MSEQNTKGFYLVAAKRARRKCGNEVRSVLTYRIVLGFDIVRSNGAPKVVRR